MIKIENLSLSINKKKILNQIQIDFFPREVNIIIGPNGAGKSSLLDIVGGLNHFYSGSVRWKNEELKKTSIKSLAEQRAYLTQNIQLQFPISVKNVIHSGRFPFYNFIPSRIDTDIISEMIAFFNLENLLNRNYLTLSGGEKQRVQFARIFSQAFNNDVNNEKILILDEPIAHLDIHQQFEFLEKLKHFTQSHNLVTILVIHDLSLAFQFASKLTLMDKGEIILHGIPKEVILNPLFHLTFQIKSGLVHHNMKEHLIIENSIV